VKTRAPPCSSRFAIACPMPARRLTPVTSAAYTTLRREDADDLAHGRGARVERLALVVGEVELDDLLDPARTELARDAHVEAVDAVLTLEVRRAWKDALLVEHDRVDHLRCSRARRVPRRRSHQVHELAAALGGARDHPLNPILRHELA